LLHSIEALALEREIPHGKNLIHDEHFGFDGGRYRETKSYLHTGAVALYRCVYELLEFRECDDVIEFASYLGALQSQYGRVQKYVFTSGKIWDETGANFDQRRYASSNRDLPVSWAADPGKHF